MAELINLTENINKKVKYWPRFNPWAIELAMHTRGLTIKELSIQSQLNINDFIKGIKEANQKDCQIIGDLLDYPLSFFEEYFPSKIVWNGSCLPSNIHIRYCDYPIFMKKK